MSKRLYWILVIGFLFLWAALFFIFDPNRDAYIYTIAFDLIKIFFVAVVLYYFLVIIKVIKRKEKGNISIWDENLNPGEWICSDPKCRSLNRDPDTKCFSCGLPKPVGEVAPEVEREIWICPNCKCENLDIYALCCSCGQLRPTKIQTAAEPAPAPQQGEPDQNPEEVPEPEETPAEKKPSLFQRFHLFICNFFSFDADVYWFCSKCGTITGASICKCGNVKPETKESTAKIHPVATPPVAPSLPKLCNKCGYPFTGGFCTNCGAAEPLPADPEFIKNVLRKMANNGAKASDMKNVIPNIVGSDYLSYEDRVNLKSFIDSIVKTNEPVSESEEETETQKPKVVFPPHKNPSVVGDLLSQDTVETMLGQKPSEEVSIKSKSSSWTKDQFTEADKILDDIIGIIESRDKERIKKNRDKSLEAAESVLKALNGDALPYAIQMRLKCNRILIAFSDSKQELPTDEIAKSLKELLDLLLSPQIVCEQVIRLLKKILDLVPDNDLTDLATNIARELRNGRHYLEQAIGELAKQSAIQLLRNSVRNILGLLGVEVTDESPADPADEAIIMEKEKPINAIEALGKRIEELGAGNIDFAKAETLRIRDSIPDAFPPELADEVLAVCDSFLNEISENASGLISAVISITPPVDKLSSPKPIAEQPAPATMAESEPLTVWNCNFCGTNNRGENRTCRGCGADNPETLDLNHPPIDWQAKTLLKNMDETGVSLETREKAIRKALDLIYESNDTSEQANHARLIYEKELDRIGSLKTEHDKETPAAEVKPIEKCADCGTELMDMPDGGKTCATCEAKAESAKKVGTKLLEKRKDFEKLISSGKNLKGAKTLIIINKESLGGFDPDEVKEAIALCDEFLAKIDTMLAETSAPTVPPAPAPPTPIATNVPTPASVLKILWQQLTAEQRAKAKLWEFAKKSWNSGPVTKMWVTIWAIPFEKLSQAEMEGVTLLGFTAKTWGQPIPEAPKK